jgi:FkbM family methyltransferase
MSQEPLRRPPPLVRALVAAFRRVPVVRGRGRLETLLHRALSARGWRDVTKTNGFRLEVLLDDLIGRTIYLNGEWERENSAAVRALVVPGTVVFDIGANAGYFTLLFSALARPGGRVYAFEPVPDTAARLRANLAINPMMSDGVDVFEFALSDRDGAVAMNVAGVANTGASRVSVGVEVEDPGRREAGVVRTLNLRCRTGDSVWAELGRPAVDLVKIDIEGHELHALRGMRETLAANLCTVLAEVRDRYLSGAGGSREQLFGLMRELGYASFDFVPETKRFLRNEVPRDGELIVFSKRALQDLES